ncbi:hypothetical protein QVD17_31375 [Tagetes erecta]|uniref:SOSEKI DIX-like domain-containing protein n=1 Tax=Tagetes erecta TaxID=13708 RepID=A0AAD8NNT4_TARER|nr:hypothetical protein QVD17_31375 [Tagetes erecta]
MYSWSFKRSYKNGYVWQDASEEDMIQPSNNHDYVLKGSELVQTLTSQNQSETYLTGSSCTSATAAEPKVVIRRRNQSWSSFDNPHEYLVVKCESSRELAGKFAPDVATQTEDESLQEHVTAEVSMVDIASSPPSNSSSEVMEGVNGDQHGNSGRMKLSQVLMQLFTCGADQSAVRKEMTVCEK